MTLEFPRFVFKDKGAELRHGGTYSVKLVADDQEYLNAVLNGWFATLLEAINPKPIPPSLPSSVVDIPFTESEMLDPEIAEDMAPATREELELRATQLGISFHHRLSNENLMKKIEEALMAKIAKPPGDVDESVKD
jgi:hypothetical protein